MLLLRLMRWSHFSIAGIERLVQGPGVLEVDQFLQHIHELRQVEWCVLLRQLTLLIETPLREKDHPLLEVLPETDVAGVKLAAMSIAFQAHGLTLRLSTLDRWTRYPCAWLDVGWG